MARLLAAGAALVVFAAIGSSAFAHDHKADGSVLTAPAIATSAPTSNASLSSSLPPAPDPFAWADAQAPFTACAATPTEPASTNGSTGHGDAHARASPDDPVVLNAATVADLQRLPGIGEKRALAVLAVRARLGRFHQIEDLLKVKGIGRATLKKLRPLVRIDGAPGPSMTDAGAKPT